jgi:tetratricopeptide (TPR) repeat protein
MQKFKLYHRIAAAAAFLVSLVVYLRTIAPTVSFWDCGEFIACSYLLAVPHPPGAPFYLLLGRLASMIPWTADIGLRVNFISALVTALTVMLTYLIIVRLIKQWRGEPKDGGDGLILIASGLLGAFALAFSDSVWFNAVEAEVYAFSLAFTAGIVYLVLLWLEKAEQEGSERYILIMAYLIGLAIGVHLLMVLAIPAIALVIYFKQLDMRGEKINLKNGAWFVLIIGLVFFAIYPGVVQYVPALAGGIGLWAVLLLYVLVLGGGWWAVTNRNRIAGLAFMGFFLVLLGYSTYALILIRSGLNPVIDENDPETAEGMVRYLNREQYGTWGTFPRRFPGLPMEWQFSQEHPNEGYKTYQWSKQMDFLWDYQIKKMYLRYFGWQFIGKGDTRGADGFIAENFTARGLYALPFLIGLIGLYYHFKKDWRHATTILGLFVVTGVAIVIYLNQENPQPRERDYVFVGSFFAFALWIGIGASALLEWIKARFYMIAPEGDDTARKNNLFKLLSAGMVALLILAIPVNLLSFNYKEHDRSGNYVAYDYSYNILQSCEKNAILFTNGDNDTFPLWFLQYVYNVRPDVRVVNLSLLNTDWYIKQLKNQEPKVPITLTDNQIEQLQLIPWEAQKIKIPVPEYARSEVLGEIDIASQAAREPLKELEVNVQPTVFGRALRVQDFMILNIIYANQFKKPITFAVTVSDDNKVNLDPYLRMDGLAFKLVPMDGEVLARERLHKNLFDNFKYRGLDDKSVFYDDNVIGLLQNYRAGFLRLAQEYLVQRNNPKVIETLDQMEKVIPESVIPVPDYRLSMRIGQLYDLAGRTDELIRRAEVVIKEQPENAMVYGYLVASLSRAGNHQRAADLLEEWLKRHPDDSEAASRLTEERALATGSR